MKKIIKQGSNFDTGPQKQGAIIGALLGLGLGLGPALLLDTKRGQDPATATAETRHATVALNNGHQIPALRISFADAVPSPSSERLFQPVLTAPFNEPAPRRSNGPSFGPHTAGVIFVSENTPTVRAHALFEPHGFKASVASHNHTKQGRLLAALREQPSFLRFMKPGLAAKADADANEDTTLGLADAVTSLEAPAGTPKAADKSQASPPKSVLADSENRRNAPLGIARDSIQFDDRPGRLSSAAEAGVWNGQPAAAVGLGYTLPSGWARVNATGVSSGQKTFGVTAVASIAFN